MPETWGALFNGLDLSGPAEAGDAARTLAPASEEDQPHADSADWPTRPLDNPGRRARRPALSARPPRLLSTSSLRPPATPRQAKSPQLRGMNLVVADFKLEEPTYRDNPPPASQPAVGEHVRRRGALHMAKEELAGVRRRLEQIPVGPSVESPNQGRIE